MGIPYAELYSIRDSKALQHTRLKMALYAIREGVKAASRKYQASRNTVRLWTRRYCEAKQNNEPILLVDRRPHTTHHPEKMEAEYEKILCETVRLRISRSQRIIASHLQRKYWIPYSVKTVINALRRNGLYERRYTKKSKKRDMRAVTDRLAFAERIQVDVKYLTDIPELKGAHKRGSIPKYQLTARDCATGAMWIGYAQEKSTTNATLFIERLFAHFNAYGVQVNDITIQTDNGNQFTTWRDSPKQTLFEQAIERFQARHRTTSVWSMHIQQRGRERASLNRR